MRVFLAGMIIWWVAFGAVSGLHNRIKDIPERTLMACIMWGSGLALFAAAADWTWPYYILAAAVGGLWAMYWGVLKLPVPEVDNAS